MYFDIRSSISTALYGLMGAASIETLDLVSQSSQLPIPEIVQGIVYAVIGIITIIKMIKPARKSKKIKPGKLSDDVNVKGENSKYLEN